MRPNDDELPDDPEVPFIAGPRCEWDDELANDPDSS